MVNVVNSRTQCEDANRHRESDTQMEKERQTDAESNTQQENIDTKHQFLWNFSKLNYDDVFDCFNKTWKILSKLHALTKFEMFFQNFSWKKLP